ncbi:MAG: hypothetical protein ABIJ20_01210 [Nanoarchaeota archaeon]|nr:hypothetical protein [Nanoarchaeota archaeon]MBU1444985.1 hypothetical protein [Nanoarchaeota archaeon]MBU2406847.1 hypothetical protein [Nanoarchaeota archaeon]MBU2420841.1 hypothetical protein [Nanoarchaeota archaeon]MBU2475817.1 hypothetical protein [Nanoarchaeota archaeon]
MTKNITTISHILPNGTKVYVGSENDAYEGFFSDNEALIDEGESLLGRLGSMPSDSRGSIRTARDGE